MWFATEDVLLQPDMEVYTVDGAAILDAWAQLRGVSVEVAGARHPDLLDFAGNYCLYFAAIQRWIPKAVGEDTEDSRNTGLEAKSSDFAIPDSSSSALTIGNSARRSRLRDAGVTELFEDKPNLSDIWSEENLPVSSIGHSPSRETSGTFPHQTIGILYMCAGRMAQELSLGLTILPPFRGYGYARQAATIALRWAFDELRCHRVQVLIMDGPHANDTSRLFAQLGFTHEGTLRLALLCENGWKDVECVAMLDTEWCVGVQRREAQSRWDVLLARHQLELEQLLEWEEKMQQDRGKGNLKSTASMETIKCAVVDVSLAVPVEREEVEMEDDDGERCPFSYCSAASSRMSSPSPGLPEVCASSGSPQLEYADPTPRLPPPAPSDSLHLSIDRPRKFESVNESDWELASASSESDFASEVSIPGDDSPELDFERPSSAGSMSSWSELETSSVESVALERRLSIGDR